MSDPFMGEIRMMSFDFPPKSWAECNGQLLPINQNQALFSLLGTTYGGDGRVNFALPNLRDRVPMHALPPTYPLGSSGGSMAVTVTAEQLPMHTHPVQATTTDAAAGDFPTGRMLGSSSQPLYKGVQQAVALRPESVTSAGGSQPHQNMQPFLGVNFCIALQGIFPAVT
jgi:microcystin-dependent protein